MHHRRARGRVRVGHSILGRDGGDGGRCQARRVGGADCWFLAGMVRGDGNEIAAKIVRLRSTVAGANGWWKGPGSRRITGRLGASLLARYFSLCGFGTESSRICQ